MNNGLQGFIDRLSEESDIISCARLRIKDIYAAAEEAGYNALALKDAFRDSQLNQDQLDKKRQREELADEYKMQLKLI